MRIVIILGLLCLCSFSSYAEDLKIEFRLAFKQNIEKEGLSREYKKLKPNSSQNIHASFLTDEEKSYLKSYFTQMSNAFGGQVVYLDEELDRRTSLGHLPVPEIKKRYDNSKLLYVKYKLRWIPFGKKETKQTFIVKQSGEYELLSSEKTTYSVDDFVVEARVEGQDSNVKSIKIHLDRVIKTELMTKGLHQIKATAKIETMSEKGRGKSYKISAVSDTQELKNYPSGPIGYFVTREEIPVLIEPFERSWVNFSLHNTYGEMTKEALERLMVLLGEIEESE